MLRRMLHRRSGGHCCSSFPSSSSLRLGTGAALLPTMRVAMRGVASSSSSVDVSQWDIPESFAEDDAPASAPLPPPPPRRFPPLIDTIISDGYRLRSDPPEESSMAIGDRSGAVRRFDVCDADHSVVRFSYNPSAAKVFMVRVPAVFTGGGQHNDQKKTKTSGSGTTRATADKKSTVGSAADPLLGEEDAEIASILSRHKAKEGVVDASHAAGSGAHDHPSVSEALAANILHLIADVESKAVLRLTPHHLAGMLSAMDPTVAARYWDARRGQRAAVSASSTSVGAVAAAAPATAATAVMHYPSPAEYALAKRMRVQLGLASPSSPSSSSSLFGGGHSATAAPLLAGRDLVGPHHVDDDLSTYWLMRGEALTANYATAEGTRGGLKRRADDGKGSKKGSSSPPSSSPLPTVDAVDTPLGPRELQWFVDELAQTVTLVSILTTRQYVLNTTGVFRLKKGHVSGDCTAMQLLHVTLTGHAVDDSLLFFHCFGEPTQRRGYAPPAPTLPVEKASAAKKDGKKGGSGAASPAGTSSVLPPGARRRIWAPIVLGPAELTPIKAFLSSCLDESLGFGSMLVGAQQHLRRSDSDASSSGKSSPPLRHHHLKSQVYFVDDKQTMYRGVAPQSILRERSGAVATAEEELTPAAAVGSDDGADDSDSQRDQLGGGDSILPLRRAGSIADDDDL